MARKVRSRIPKNLIKAFINWYDHNRGTGKNRLLTGTVTKSCLKNYKQRDTRGKPPKSHRVIKVLNPSKEDHQHWRFRDIWPRRKQGRYDWQQSTAMGRGRGGSGIGVGSRRGIFPGRGRGINSGRVHNSTSRREKAKSWLSKSLDNSMFIYREKNPLTKCEEHRKRSSKKLELLLAKTLVQNCKQAQ